MKLELLYSALLYVSVALSAPGDKNLAPIREYEHADPESIIANTYIVQLKSSASGSAHRESFLNKFLNEHDDVKLLYEYDLEWFQGYAIEVQSESSLTDLRISPDIEALEYDQVASADSQQTGATWNLNRISQRGLPIRDTYFYDSKAGEGVEVYVLDTGIRLTHSEFGGRAWWGTSFVGGNDRGDPNGHGTHVAAIVAGYKFGVAKRARVIAVRVLDADSKGAWSTVMKGVEWACKSIKSRGKPAVINMSISGSKSDALNSMINGAIKNYIHVVVAAGNNGQDACNYSPASATYAITVGSTDIDDRISSFSNHGKCVDILAPGGNVLSAWTGHDRAYASDSGTSMAAPHVAGVKALLLARSNRSPAVIDAIMRQSATKNMVKSLPSGINYLLYSAPPTSFFMEPMRLQESLRTD